MQANLELEKVERLEREAITLKKVPSGWCTLGVVCIRGGVP